MTINKEYLYAIVALVIGLGVGYFIHSGAKLGGTVENFPVQYVNGLYAGTSRQLSVDSSGNLSTSGTLAATGGVSGFATSSLSTLTVTGATALNGGLTMDTNKFSVADASGNTLIAGTLGVTGTSSLGITSITGALSNSASSTFSGGAAGVFFANDGTIGKTGSCASTTDLTVKNGLITDCN